MKSLPLLQKNELKFPAVDRADQNGIVAFGGDLGIKRLMLAYRSGIFPWYSEGQPITWWSPDPRFVLFPENLKVSTTLKRTIKSGKFRVTFDRDFPAVINNCRTVKRAQQPGTWITGEMVNAYCALHKAGYAHSVEVWQDAELVGGLYGVSVGRCFCGESMFAKVSDASKVGFVTLAEHLAEREFRLIDCQVYTEHLARFGAILIPRFDFINLLNHAMESKVEWTITAKA